jgi:single-strand DNA-binding protein
MASFNKVILLGNLTRDVEMKYTQGGTAVAELGLAINHSYRDSRTNEKKEEVTFVDVTFFGRTAEIASEYLAKGRPVLIEGRLKYEQWQDKQAGANRSKLRIIGDTLQLLGGKEGGQAAATRPANSRTADAPLSPEEAIEAAEETPF